MKHWNIRGIALCLTLLVIVPGVLFAQDCTIIVPDNPLSAQGLATPYQLTCDETDPGMSAFVQAAIIDPVSGQISIYNPLVTTQEMAPLAAPVLPVLPTNAIVALWFGFNGNNLTQKGATGSALVAGHCVNGLPGNIFGQFSYCNAPAFFKAANQAIRRGKLQVPPLGEANDGLPCPTVRDFFVVDQDQSDNLPVSYLGSAVVGGQVAQNIAANTGLGTPFGNPSDNGLVDKFLDPALGCTPWKAPDLADNGKLVPALALNELQARAYQQAPVALIPAGDPMAMDNGGDGPIDLRKVNAYRLGTDQPLAWSLSQADTGRYCRHLLKIAPARLLQNQTALTAANSPLPDVADSLFTFLAQRFVGTYDILHCGDFVPIADPVSVTMSGDVVTGATINVPLYNKAMHYIAPYQRWDHAADDADAKACSKND